MSSNLKSILKPSGSFERRVLANAKTAKFDELNVLQTLHPANKDYGFMPITAPKTPYEYNEYSAPRANLDNDVLLQRLRNMADNQPPTFDGENDEVSSENEEHIETAEEKVRRLEFERRRKAHYKEFGFVEVARRLIADEIPNNIGDNENDVRSIDRTSLNTESICSSKIYETDTVNQIDSDNAGNTDEAEYISPMISNEAELPNFDSFSISSSSEGSEHRASSAANIGLEHPCFGRDVDKEPLKESGSDADADADANVGELMLGPNEEQMLKTK